MESFKERYKSYSNTRLVEIIANGEDYQEEALKSAKEELQKRKLSDAEEEQIYAELAAIDADEKRALEQRKAREKQLQLTIKNFFNPINPLLAELSKLERNIRLITLVFGGIAVYQLIVDFDSLVYVFTSSHDWDFTVLLFLIPYIGLPIAVYLFWKRKKIGWIFMLIYIFVGLLNIAFMFYYAYNYSYDNMIYYEEMYLPPSIPSAYILPFLFYVGCVWVMIDKKMRKSYFNQ